MLGKKKSKISINLFIELLHFNNFIPFKFPLQTLLTPFLSLFISRNYNKLDGDLHPILHH